jgi:ATPase family AAA domain-containing protein 2
LRKRSGSYGAKHPPTASSIAQPIRRSSRLSHDEDEPVIALTNSGHHVEIVRPGSRDPDGIPARALKGGKGLKYPSKSTIDEEEESVHTTHDLADELEIKASQHDVPESEPQTQPDSEDTLPQLQSDVQDLAEDDDHAAVEVLHESQEGAAEEDEDEEPFSRGRKRASTRRKTTSPPAESQGSGNRLRPRGLRAGSSKRASRSTRRKAQEESSDFEPQGEPEKEDDMSSSGESQHSLRKGSQRNDDYDSSNGGRKSARLRKKGNSNHSPVHSEDEEDELAAEIQELKRDGKKRRTAREEILFEPRGTRRAGKRPNYDMLKGLAPIDDEEEAAPTPSQKARRTAGGGWQRNLFNIYGPFGGAGGLAPVLGGPSGLGAQGDVDSDSSDDDIMKRPKPIGGTVGMTPTSAFPPGLGLFPPGQTLNSDPAQAAAGTPANLGKLKDKQALADADPLGVDQNVNFDSVGGLQGHIDQLKEMVSLPLLYPEIFMRFHIVPPRGVLFYGPPGTGKTLLARALASSVSSQGKKVTFYMRKGADALSKWVGEAERQLRLLFEEARKNQPSIIFFDEIDGKTRETHTTNYTNQFRPCTRPIQQTRPDSRVYCVDSVGAHGRNGWSRPSNHHWRHQSA